MENIIEKYCSDELSYDDASEQLFNSLKDNPNIEELFNYSEIKKGLSLILKNVS